MKTKTGINSGNRFISCNVKLTPISKDPIDIPTAEANRSGRLPHLSTRIRPTKAFGIYKE
jgi:hypothetical protein